MNQRELGNAGRKPKVRLIDICSDRTGKDLLLDYILAQSLYQLVEFVFLLVAS